VASIAGVRRPAPDLDSLLAQFSDREPLVSTDGASGAPIERVSIDGETLVLKHLDLTADWTRRATGDAGCRAIRLWETGFYDELPPTMDSAVVGAARVPGTGDGALLMRDVGRWLVPTGDDEVPMEQHRRFLDHAAAFHARFWGLEDELELVPLAHRTIEFQPETYATELALGNDPVPLRLSIQGFDNMRTLAPRMADVVLPLLADPSPLVAACERVAPMTLVHGNLKFGNLGSHPDGRSIVLDWGELTGRAPAAIDLAWYLAINCRRLPESKEATIEAYRLALEANAIDTAGWFDAQVDLSCISTACLLGWEKCLGGYDDELAWWDEKVQAAAPRVDSVLDA
jgi:hypothetical protein